MNKSDIEEKNIKTLKSFLSSQYDVVKVNSEQHKIVNLHRDSHLDDIVFETKDAGNLATVLMNCRIDELKKLNKKLSNANKKQ